MGSPNVLIVSGCSFTQVPNKYKNWPLYLRDKLKISAFFLGVGSFGNDMISKRIIYQTSQSLLKYKPESLLVGVMWSGVSRKSFYLQNDPVEYMHFFEDPYTKKEYIPFSFGNPNSLRVDGTKNIYAISPHWKDELSATYYKLYYDEVGAVIETIENILRVQWFLKLNNIRYFFSEYSYDSLTVATEKFKDHPDVKYLYDQIDFTNFLPVKNMEQWIRQESGIPYTDPNDHHPTDEMSEAFADRIIIPHLKSKGYIR